MNDPEHTHSMKLHQNWRSNNIGRRDARITALLRYSYQVAGDYYGGTVVMPFNDEEGS